MGYCASGHGCITMKYRLPIEVIDEIENVLREQFEVDTFKSNASDADAKVSFDVWTDYDKYYEDAVWEVLETVAKLTVIESGEIEYYGDDDCHWRFIYKDSKWEEQDGHIVYEERSEIRKANRYFSLLRNALGYIDGLVGEREDIRFIAEECIGLSEKEVDLMFEDEQ